MKLATVIIAKTYTDAVVEARSRGLKAVGWTFVNDAMRMKGLRGNPIVLVAGWEDLPDALELRVEINMMAGMGSPVEGVLVPGAEVNQYIRMDPYVPRVMVQ